MLPRPSYMLPPWYSRACHWMKKHPIKTLIGIGMVGVFVASLYFAWPAIVAGAGISAVCSAIGGGFGVGSTFSVGVGGALLGVGTIGTALAIGKVFFAARREIRAKRRHGSDYRVIAYTDEVTKGNSNDDNDRRPNPNNRRLNPNGCVSFLAGIFGYNRETSTSNQMDSSSLDESSGEDSQFTRNHEDLTPSVNSNNYNNYNKM